MTTPRPSRSWLLFEAVPEHVGAVVFRYPSGLARFVGMGRVILCLTWILAAALCAKCYEGDGPASDRWAIYGLTGLLSLPAFSFVLFYLRNLWTRRLVIIRPAGGTVSEITRMPLKEHCRHHPSATATAVEVTRLVEADESYSWLVEIRLLDEVSISLGCASREEEALAVARRAAAALNVPLREVMEPER